MAKKGKTEEPVVDVTKFKERKLKLINEMQDKAKARFLAQRVINNK